MVIGTPTVLNLIPGGVMKVIHVNQVNENIEIQFRIMNGAQPFNVPEGVSCTIRGTKGDNFGYAADVAVTAGSNIVTATLTEQLTAVAGAGNIFELVFVGASDDMKVSTENFILDVERAALGEDTVVSDSDLAYADQVLNQLQSVGAVNAQVQQNKANIAAEITRATAAEQTLQQNINAEAAARQAADNTLQININAEASSRATTDASLQSQINQLVAPSGSAPSAAEVENARIGSDGTVYSTLGDAIRTQNSLLKSQLQESVGAIFYSGGLNTLKNDPSADTTKTYIVNVPGNALNRYRMVYDSTLSSWVYDGMLCELNTAVPEDDFLSNFLWESKGINMTGGGKTASSTRAVTVDYLSSVIKTIISKSGYRFALFAYNRDNSYVGNWNGSSFVKTGSVNFFHSISIAESWDYKFLVVAAKNDNAEISVTEAKNNIVLAIGNYATNDTITSIYNTTVLFEYGGVYSNNGTLADSTARIRTLLTTIDENCINGKLTVDTALPEGYLFKWIVFYKNGTYVSSASSGYSSGHGEWAISGWNQFRIVFSNATGTDIPYSELENARLTITAQSFTSYIFNAFDKRITSCEVKKDDWFLGKKYSALGDSITYGYIPRNYTGYPGQLKSFAALTAEAFGMIFQNKGVAGSTLAYYENEAPMSRRWNALDDDADLITVMGGTNDIRRNIPVGTMADRTDATYYGALHVIFGGLYKKYMIDQGTTVGKKKIIVALTPIKLLDPASAEVSTGEGTLLNLVPYVDAMKEVAAYYSIPVFDFYNLSGINPQIDRTVHGTETGYTGYYNPYITDGTHPTQEGAEIMAQRFMGFLKTLV